MSPLRSEEASEGHFRYNASAQHTIDSGCQGCDVEWGRGAIDEQLAQIVADYPADPEIKRLLDEVGRAGTLATRATILKADPSAFFGVELNGVDVWLPPRNPSDRHPLRPWIFGRDPCFCRGGAFGVDVGSHA